MIVRIGLLGAILIAGNLWAHNRHVWESSHYIWDFGLISACDLGIDRNPERYFSGEPTFNKHAYRNIKSGDLVWVQCRFIPDFCRDILPMLRVPIVLLVSDGDESFPSDCGNQFNIHPLLENPNIIHIFAQNYDMACVHPKISHIPIGTDFHTSAYKGREGGWGECGSPLEQEARLRNILNHLKPTNLRKKRAFVDFHHADTMHGGFKRYLQFGEDRASIFRKIMASGLIDHDSWMRRSKLWEVKGEYAFSVSPHGNGLDCHRTWEDLILGCIVIVRSSPLDPLYEGLPVVIVKDWSEITPANLDRWLAQFGDAFTNPSYREKLTNRYWLAKMRGVAQSYRSN